MNFLEELKRRNVVRVGIAYAVSAWVVLQFADLVLENTEAPSWVMDVLMLFVALGFLVSLVIAWAFELTPEGIKREKDVVRDDSITQQTGRKLEWITLGAAAMVLALFLFERFGADDLPATDPEVVIETAGPTDGAGQPPASPESSSPASPTDAAGDLTRGVAVLPFDNLSTEQANAYFASGVHEDVLSHLSRIQGLRIISRTSMQRIAEQNLAVREIGSQLDVSHVLEGSVRRAGDQVRVTVQLVDAATDQQLWSENYDRQLDDIFAIQSEIASAIADQLQTELSPQELAAIEAPPTDNVLAYDAYLKARESERVWRGAAGFREQREHLEQALAIDPDFLDAQVKLAYAYGRLVWTSDDPDGRFRVLAKELTESIQRDHPGTLQAIRARSDYRYTVMRDYDAALEGYERLLAVTPNDVDLLLRLSSSLKRLDRHSEGLQFVERAIELDPENAVLPSERSFHLLGLGRVDETIALLHEALLRFPDDQSTRANLASILLLGQGDKAGFRAELPDRFGSSGSLQNPQFDLIEGYEIRLGLEEFGLDAILAVLEAARVEADPWTNAAVDLYAAEALNLSGRESESVALAEQLVADFRGRMAQGMKFPSTRPRLWLAMHAYAACLADDPDTANLLTGIAGTLPVDDPSEVNQTLRFFVLAQAECGDIERAWVSANQELSGTYRHKRWDLVVDPIYAHYFGAMPEYQEFVQRLQGSGA